MLILLSTTRDAGYRTLNAMDSWRRFADRIILFGFEGREAKLKAGFGFVWNVDRNSHGTPLVSDIFDAYPDQGNTFVFVNSDVMLFSVEEAIAKVEALDIGGSWLMVGQRRNMDIQDRINFEGLDLAGLHNLATHYQYLPPCGIDYFIWRNVDWSHMPPFAVGRLAYDNWIVYDALQRCIPVIDATRVILAAHQNHPEREGVRQCPEARENFRMAKQYYPKWTAWDGWIHHATYRIS